MIDDMLKLVIDPLFPPSAYKVDNKRENDFELLYCGHQSRYSPTPINKRQNFNVSLYPVKELYQKKNPMKIKKEAETNNIINWKKVKRKSIYPTAIKCRPKIKHLYDTITLLIETYPFEDCDPFLKPVK